MVNGEIQGLEKELHLKQDFSDPSREDWLREVEKVLKGAPYEKVLKTQTAEGITLEPIYTREDAEKYVQLENLPGYAPYLRNTDIAGKVQNGWGIAQELDVQDIEEWNKTILADLMKGQTSVRMSLDDLSGKAELPSEENKEKLGKNGLPIFNYEDFKKALKDIAVDQVRIDIQAFDSALTVLAMLKIFAKENNADFTKIQGSVTMDPVFTLVKNGYLNTSWKQLMDEMAETIRYCQTNNSSIKTISVNAEIWNQSGSSAVEDLAFAFSTAVAYINEMLDRGLTIDEIAPCFIFSFGIGSNMFMEISKLRAARMVWAQIIEMYQGNEESQKIYIHAKTSEYNKTWYDPWVNILRTTTESFSAIIGGCDSLHVTPFDSVIGASDEFSRRIARNQQIIMLEESHLNAVIDPAGGSWYIETLTHQLAEKTWELFKETETLGGMIEALKQDFPQNKVQATHTFRYNNLASRKNVMIGTSIFANLIEKPIVKSDTDPDAYLNKVLPSAVKEAKVELNGNLMENIEDAVKKGCSIVSLYKQIRETASDLQVKPLELKRLTETIEKIRQSVETYNTKHDVPAKAFFASVGGFLQLKLRADFVSTFIQPSGFEVENSRAFETPELAIAAALDSKAIMTVIVGTDDDYPHIVPLMAQQLKKANPNMLVALAGYPKDHIEAFTQNGVDLFIHLKANLIDTFNEMIKKAGI